MFKAKKLEKIMKENRTKGKELAKIVGVSPTTISSWKNGDKIPKIENIEKICKYFEVSIEYFTEEKDDENIKKYEIKEIRNSNNIAMGEKARISIIENQNLEPIDITILDLIKNMTLEEKAELIKFIAQNKNS